MRSLLCKTAVPLRGGLSGDTNCCEEHRWLYGGRPMNRFFELGLPSQRVHQSKLNAASLKRCPKGSPPGVASPRGLDVKLKRSAALCLELRPPVRFTFYPASAPAGLVTRSAQAMAALSGAALALSSPGPSAPNAGPSGATGEPRLRVTWHMPRCRGPFRPNALPAAGFVGVHAEPRDSARMAPPLDNPVYFMCLAAAAGKLVANLTFGPAGFAAETPPRPAWEEAGLATYLPADFVFTAAFPEDLPAKAYWRLRLAELVRQAAPHPGERIIGTAEARPRFEKALSMPMFRARPWRQRQNQILLSQPSGGGPVGPPPKDKRRAKKDRFRVNIPAPVRVAVLSAMAAAILVYCVSRIPVILPRPKWDSLREQIRARATVDLRDDFQSRFAAWEGTDNWKIDETGFAVPGQLGLYRPSIPLSDYRMEFRGQIVKRGLSFVVHARDRRNYWVTKLVLTKRGPLPSGALIRYAVFDGREGPRERRPLPFSVQDDTLYSVLVAVEGKHVTTTVNGQFVDSWEDDRLTSGGVGFFAEKGEVWRLNGVRVFDKDDLLGRICSQVSPGTADRRETGVRNE